MSVRQLTPPKNVPVNKDKTTLRHLQEDVNRLFENFFGETQSLWRHGMEAFLVTAPAIDIAENDTAFTLTAEVPGIDVEDVEVTAADGYVTIKGKKTCEKKEESEHLFRQERCYGAFQRTLHLPRNADVEKAQATLAKGVMTISIPKKADALAKQHKITVNQAA